MDRNAFKAAVKLHHDLNNLEKALRVAKDRTPESFVFEGNSLGVSLAVKAEIIADLESQISETEEKLSELLAPCPQTLEENLPPPSTPPSPPPLKPGKASPLATWQKSTTPSS